MAARSPPPAAHRKVQLQGSSKELRTREAASPNPGTSCQAVEQVAATKPVADLLWMLEGLSGLDDGMVWHGILRYSL